MKATVLDTSCDAADPCWQGRGGRWARRRARVVFFGLSGADLAAVEVREDVDPVLVVRAGIEAIEHVRRKGLECALDAVRPYHV